MDDFLLMCKDLKELQEAWKPKDGDRVYSEYSEKDKKFAKEHWNSDEKGHIWYVSNFEFLNSSEGKYEPYLKETSIYLPYLDDMVNLVLDAGIELDSLIPYDKDVLLDHIASVLWGKIWNWQEKKWNPLK